MRSFGGAQSIYLSFVSYKPWTIKTADARIVFSQQGGGCSRKGCAKKHFFAQTIRAAFDKNCVEIVLSPPTVDASGMWLSVHTEETMCPRDVSGENQSFLAVSARGRLSVILG